ncbi:IS3 family transposase [Pseudomonas alkylphenolica]|uniref:IS3 family transposase n=1 Tax=Pseudomonas alkylphenolica TaxID=237609 RepID=UPI0018D65A55|nr:IS3 family transposase [Pseudomonas alkylphenolica]
MRYAFVAKERAHFPIRLMCRVLGVSASGFYGYLSRPARPDPDAQIRTDLRRIHVASRNTYGRPRLVEALRQILHPVGHKRVARLMREEGIHGKAKARFRPNTTDSRHFRPVASNVLDRQFSVQSTRPAWVSDITYIPTREGWLYLAVVLSIQTRQVLGYSLADKMPDDLVERAFINAWSASLTPTGVVFHSDQGRQYASSKFRQTLAEKGFTQSMSRKANCWDNAVAESFFATLKKEEANKTYQSKKQAYGSIASYIHGFYNSCRLHSALGYRSPNAFAKDLKCKP